MSHTLEQFRTNLNTKGFGQSTWTNYRHHRPFDILHLTFRDRLFNYFVMNETNVHRPIHILFLCVANSARSQIAEGLANSIFRGQAIIESAGSEPSGIVHPWAIEVLKEENIDISQNRSKSTNELSSEFLAHLSFIITLCAEEVCPLLPCQAKRLHWPLQDPAQLPELQKEEAFRNVHKDIKKRLMAFKAELKLN